MLARFSSCYRRFFLPSFAGFSGTTAMLSKIEKNLLFGTTRNRQVIAETTKSSGLTASECFPRGDAAPPQGLGRVPAAAGSMDFVGRTTAEDLNPGDRISRQYVVRAIPQRFQTRRDERRRTAVGATGK
jgi:hypothetical protein